MPSLSLGLGLHKNRIFTAGGGGNPFSPSDLSGLSLWLSADAGVTLSGSNVTAWADRSGNGLNVAPDIETSDITLASSVTKLNNKPAVLFQVSSNSGDVGLFNSNPFIGKSVFIAYSLENVDNFTYSVPYENNGANLYTSYADGNRAFGGYFNGFFDSNTTSTLATSYVRTIVADDDGQGNNPINFFINGQYDGSPNGGGFYNLRSEIVIGNGGARVLGPSPDTNQPFQGYIAEIVVYNVALTTLQRQQVEAYLMAKYAILPLPSGFSVAGTNQISISGAAQFNGVYNRTNSSGVYIPEPIPGTYNYISANGANYLTSPGNTNYNNDYAGNDWVLATGSDGVTIYSENTSTDAAIIPANGWSPSITITAI